MNYLLRIHISIYMHEYVHTYLDLLIVLLLNLFGIYYKSNISLNRWSCAEFVIKWNFCCIISSLAISLCFSYSHLVDVLLVWRWFITAHSIGQVRHHAALQASCLSDDRLFTGKFLHCQVCIVSRLLSLPSLDLQPHCWNALLLPSATMNLCCLSEKRVLEKRRQYSTWQSSCVSISWFCCAILG